MVVPVGTAVKLFDPKSEPDVPPNGLDVVLVVPNRPPLLVLVPKSAKRRGRKNKVSTPKTTEGQLQSYPRAHAQAVCSTQKNGRRLARHTISICSGPILWDKDEGS